METIKRNQLDIKYTITEIKAILEGIKSRLDEMDGQFGRYVKRKYSIRAAKMKK